MKINSDPSQKKGPTRKMFKHEKCRICGEQASGFNYRVVSCNACKGIRSKYQKTCYLWRSILGPLPLDHWEHFNRWTLKIFQIFYLSNMSDLDWPWIRSVSDFIADVCQKSSRDWSKMQNKLNLFPFLSILFEPKKLSSVEQSFPASSMNANSKRFRKNHAWLTLRWVIM